MDSKLGWLRVEDGLPECDDEVLAIHVKWGYELVFGNVMQESSGYTHWLRLPAINH